MDSNIVPASKVTEGAARLAPPNMISQEATARNYASKECGAKVLFSNDEAENKVIICNSAYFCKKLIGTLLRLPNGIIFHLLQNAVLNEKEADDYMRNPCERAEHKWLIIELCETIQV